MSIYNKYLKIDEIKKGDFTIKPETNLSEFNNDINAISRVELIYESNFIADAKNPDVALTFEEIYSLVQDTSKFVTLKSADIWWLLPSMDFGGDAIMFTSTDVVSENAELYRVIINSNDEISDYFIPLENRNLKMDDLETEAIGEFKCYPTVKAVKDAIAGLGGDLPLEKGTGSNSLIQKNDSTDVTNVSEGQYSIALGWGSNIKGKYGFAYSDTPFSIYVTGSETTYTINRCFTLTYWNQIKGFIDPSMFIGNIVMLTTDRTNKHFITNAVKNDSNDIVITVDSTLGSLSNKSIMMQNFISQNYSTIIGSGLNVGTVSHIRGRYNFCKSNNTIIDGMYNVDNNTISGVDNGHNSIIGFNNGNIGNYSTVIGSKNKNNAKQSYLIGSTNTNNGETNYILGGSNTNATTVNNSVTIGVQNTNNGTDNIFNLGMINTANGKYNHLFGHGLVTNNQFEGAFGTYNVSLSDTLFSVGIGSNESSRKNGLEIKSDGRVLGKDGKEIAYIDDVRPLKINSTANTTVGSYQVPQLTSEDVTNAYNAVIEGRAVIIIDKDNIMHAFVNQADNLNNEKSIGILYYSYALLTYTLSGDNVSIDYKEIK